MASSSLNLEQRRSVIGYCMVGLGYLMEDSLS